jgi:hypothetical protein
VSGLFAAPAGCALLSASVVLSPAGAGVREATTLELADVWGCDHVDVALPPGVTLSETSARTYRTDGTKAKLGDERWERPTRDAGDAGYARLVVPELMPGDHVTVRLVRTWAPQSPLPGGPFVWTPAADGLADVDVRGEGVSFAVVDDHETITQEWAANPPKSGVTVVAAAADRAGTALSAAIAPAVVASGSRAVDDALLALSNVVIVPRGVDGAAPVSGDAGLARGAMDDRGVALTLAAMTAGGPTPGELAFTPRYDAAPGADEAWSVAVGNRVLVADAGDRDVLGAGLPVPGVAPVEALPSAVPASDRVRIERTLTLAIPGADPMVSLYPGQGSSLGTSERLVFAAADRARVWVEPLPPGHRDVAFDVDPDDSVARVTLRDDAAVIVVPPSDDQTAVTLSWVVDDAPACGEIDAVAGADLDVNVVDPQGRVRREGAFWSLTEHGGDPIMPDHDRVARGLVRRFDAASLPEPSIPMELRGAKADVNLLELLRAAIVDHARIAPVGEPLWPRRLRKALASRLLTGPEGAAVLALYMRQADFPARMTLVRPADRGPGDDVCPAGFDAALVRVIVDGVTHWMDPGCPSCAVFELRPELEGATAFAEDVAETPPPTPGVEAITVAGNQLAVHLEGPAALGLRIALAEMPSDRRAQFLAERFGGAGAALVSAEGISTAGSAIDLKIQGTLAEDPLAMPPARPDGTSWLGWVGVRTVTRPLASAAGLAREHVTTPDGAVTVARLPDTSAAVNADLGAMVYTRMAAGGRVVETLDVRDRAVPRDAVDQLAKARVTTGGPAPTAPAPFPAIVAATTPSVGATPASVPRGTVVQVLGVDGADALVRLPGGVTRVARADLLAIPFRARVTGKAATTKLLREPTASSAVAERLATAGDPLFVTEVRGQWAKIDVEGPLSQVRRVGWLPLDVLAPEPSSDVIELGDLSLAAWTPVSGVPMVVLDKPIAVRGVAVPQDAVLVLGDSGRVVAIELPVAATVGGAPFPAGTRFELVDPCTLAVAGACWDPGADGVLAPRVP